MLFSKQIPWYMGQARRAILNPIQTFWDTYRSTWLQVYQTKEK